MGWAEEAKPTRKSTGAVLKSSENYPLPGAKGTDGITGSTVKTGGGHMETKIR